MVRIGEVLFGTCPCEAQTDQVVNFKTRADAVTGNLHDGYEWPCSPSPTAADKVVCSYPNPTAPASHIASKARWELALTQVHNDARDPDQPGNFSKVELGAGEIDAALYAGDGSVTGTLSFDGVAGFPVAFMLAQAQDYVGYIVSYREFMARDHYRKTLTSFGPHSSDYINTFLMRGASVLRTGAADPLLGLFARPLPDPQREAEYQAFAGLQGEAAVAGYEAGLPDDSPLAGSPQQQPASKTRFGVARFSWYGGSNATDLPRVVVVDAAGQTVATNDYGEIVTTVAFPTVRTAADWVAAGRPYIWTAHWEIGVDTPPGAYGFVVDGLRRAGGATVAYDLESAAFTVSRWTSGGAIGDPVVQPDRITFTVGSAPYPNEYFAEDANDPRKPRFIDPSNVYRRTFRPRPLAWSAARAFVTVTHADNTISTIEAFLVGGEWVALYAVQPGDLVSVLPSDVVDADGNPAG